LEDELVTAYAVDVVSDAEKQPTATSAEIASEVGPFPRYQANRDHMLRVIRNHRRAAYNAAPAEYEGLTVTPVGIDARYCPAELVSAARTESDRMLELGEKHGYRNAQVTVIAPRVAMTNSRNCSALSSCRPA
jgi:ribonucleoside-diphosphate reductase alpha chain